jgi:Tol biopolymer transport system component
VKRLQQAARASALVSVLVLAAFTACSGDNGGPAGTTTLTPVPSGTITATGSIAYITPDMELALMNPDGAAQRVIYGDRTVARFSWSPDGSRIAAVVATGGGPATAVMTPEGEVLFEVVGANDPIWSPLGNQLLTLTEQGLLVVDTSGQEVLTAPTGKRPLWAPDGSQIAYLQTDGEGRGVPVLVDVDSGAEEPLSDSIQPSETDYPALWHPAGDVIAYKDSLYEPGEDISTPTDGVSSQFSPDGRILIQTLGTDATTGATVARMYDFSQGGKAIIGFDVRQSPEGESPWFYLNRWTDWSSDGRIFLYLDPEVLRPQARIYDTVAVTQERFPNIKGTAPEISPSGTHAAFFDEGKVWVLALDGTALVNVADGTQPSWKPAAQ